MTSQDVGSAFDLLIKRTLNATRERVFRAWTDPEAIKQWFAPNEQFSVPLAEVDLRVGGSYRIQMDAPDGSAHTMFGTYREVVEPERLVFTMWWEELAEKAESLVTIELREVGSSTELILTHEQLPDAEWRDEQEKGWVGCLETLAKYLA